MNSLRATARLPNMREGARGGDRVELLVSRIDGGIRLMRQGEKTNSRLLDKAILLKKTMRACKNKEQPSATHLCVCVNMK